MQELSEHEQSLGPLGGCVHPGSQVQLPSHPHTPCVGPLHEFGHDPGGSGVMHSHASPEKGGAHWQPHPVQTPRSPPHSGSPGQRVGHRQSGGS